VEEYKPLHISYKVSPRNFKSIEEESEDLNTSYQERRSCRHFSSKPLPKELIENLIRIAASAPSGAHKQPWHFVAISDPILKKKIRKAAEKEEHAFYQERASDNWLKDLKVIGTDANKEFLETAPWLIIVFKRSYDVLAEGLKAKNYYVNESVGIASGFLISAIHHLGLATLTHTPSPMDFLSKILERPIEEKPFLLLPVGYPALDAQVPDLKRKPLENLSNFY
jgi:iodotyrosine deiodinase